jgi:hypothetical protein
MAVERKLVIYALVAIVLLTSVAALAANLGLFGLDPGSNFAKVSLSAILVEAAVTFFFLARQVFSGSSKTISATIKFPDTIDQSHLLNMRWDLPKCMYEVRDTQAQIKDQGQVVIVLDNSGWECKLPNVRGLDDSIELRIVEDNGKVWEVPSFYPLTRTLEAREGKDPSLIHEKLPAKQVFLAVERDDKKSSVPAVPVQTIQFSNRARFLRKEGERSRYDWLVYVDEDESVLQDIESVEYLLHRTYPNPLRRRDDPKNRFALRSNGWGTSAIYITVFFKNGTELKTSYYLDLTKPWDEQLAD